MPELHEDEADAVRSVEIDGEVYLSASDLHRLCMSMQYKNVNPDDILALSCLATALTYLLNWTKRFTGIN